MWATGLRCRNAVRKSSLIPMGTATALGASRLEAATPAPRAVAVFALDGRPYGAEIKSPDDLASGCSSRRGPQTWFSCTVRRFLVDRHVQAASVFRAWVLRVSACDSRHRSRASRRSARTRLRPGGTEGRERSRIRSITSAGQDLAVDHLHIVGEGKNRAYISVFIQEGTYQASVPTPYLLHAVQGTRFFFVEENLVHGQTDSCGFCAVCLPARGVPAPRRSPAATRHGAVRAIQHARASTPNVRRDSALGPV